MEFEWDEEKRRAVFLKRGVDLAEAALIFEGPFLSQVDRRADYGEVRFVSVGRVGADIYTVVHTGRGPVIRLITAWKGGVYDLEELEKRHARRITGDEGSR
ncbi:BrnT family toxin [Pseudoroseicyclus sp. H15]